jgi:hypothetical protein
MVGMEIFSVPESTFLAPKSGLYVGLLLKKCGCQTTIFTVVVLTIR